MKFIVFSDQHLGKKLFNIPELEQDQRDLFKLVVDKAIELEVDYLISVGDLFDDNKPTSDTIKFVKDQLDRLKKNRIEPLAIAGDHSKPVHGTSWEEVAGFTAVNEASSGEFVGVDYDDNPQTVLTKLNYELSRRAENSVRFLFLHQQIPELWPFCQEKKQISLKDIDLSNHCKSIEMIFLGDIHIRREMRYHNLTCNKELFVGYCGSLGVTASDETKKDGLYYYDGKKLQKLAYELPRKYVMVDIHDYIDGNTAYYKQFKELHESYKSENRPVFVVRLHNGIDIKDLGDKLNFLYEIGYVRISKMLKNSEGSEEMVNIRSELKTADRISEVLRALTQGADHVYDLAYKLITTSDPKTVLDEFKQEIYKTT
jgi:hypothetical protein